MDIISEIEKLKKELSNIESIDQYDYMSPSIKELQTIVLYWHMHFNRGMDNFIMYKIKNNLDGAGAKTITDIFSLIREILRSVSYREKIGLVKKLCGINERLSEFLIKINTARIEFAHSSGGDLKIKYDYCDYNNANKNRAKENYRNILRSIKETSSLMNNEFLRLLEKTKREKTETLPIGKSSTKKE